MKLGIFYFIVFSGGYNQSMGVHHQMPPQG